MLNQMFSIFALIIKYIINKSNKRVKMINQLSESLAQLSCVHFCRSSQDNLFFVPIGQFVLQQA